MYLGIACKEGKVSEHFGQSDELRIFEICEDQYKQLRTIEGFGHKHEGFPQIVIASDIHVLICGHMGEKARRLIESHDIEIISGAQGDIGEVLNLYLKHELISVIDDCKGHNHDHDHHHHD